jgi:hypothetical protein
MRINSNTPLGDLLALLAALPDATATLDGLLALPATAPVPPRLLVDYDALTFGQLWGCFNLADARGVLSGAIPVVTGLSPAAVPSLRAAEALAFAHRHLSELRRIGELFARVAYKPTPDEVAAGINDHPSGMHGVADWYARRMGIHDIEEVERLPWARVYNAMLMDHHDATFRRRLAKIENDRMKLKLRH